MKNFKNIISRAKNAATKIANFTLEHLVGPAIVGTILFVLL